MGQLNFQMNYNAFISNGNRFAISNGMLSFFGFNIYDSISFKTIQLGVERQSGSQEILTMSLGLYSLTGSTLSLANSASRAITYDAGGAGLANGVLSLTSTSATQNITPGTWFWGFLFSTSSVSLISLLGQMGINPGNAFPGGFIGGIMTDSTAGLPSSYATSDLDITGSDAMQVPLIILSS